MKSESSGFGDEAEAKFSFTGDDGTEFTRTFSMDSQGLHVHHDIFESASKGDGIAKQLFAGSVPLYDKIGVKSISTLANIDIGAYSWARYGFEAKSPQTLSRQLAKKAEEFFKESGLFSDADWDRYKGMLAKGSDDKRFRLGHRRPEVLHDPGAGGSAQGQVEDDAASRHRLQREGTLGGDLQPEDRRGRGAGDRQHRPHPARRQRGQVQHELQAALDLTDDDQVKRLEGYIGQWRVDRRSSEEQLAAARRAQGDPRGSGAARAQAAQAAQAEQQAARAIYDKAGRFNTRMDAWQKQNTASGGRKLDRDSTNRVWQAVQRGVPFDKAVADLQAQIAKVNKQTRGADRENRFQKAVQRSRTNPTLTGLASRPRSGPRCSRRSR